MLNARHMIGISDETRDLLEEFKFTHKEQIRVTKSLEDGRIRHDDVIYYALLRVKEFEKVETIRKAKEQTTEILKEKEIQKGEGEANAQNNNIQESENNII